MDTTTTYDVYAHDCPTRAVLDRIADKWTVLVIGLLVKGPRRFSDLKRKIGGISQKMLTQTLRSLERDGLISRKVFPVVPPHVEYELTPLGHTLTGLITEVKNWAEDNIREVTSAQQSYDNIHETTITK